MNQLLAFIRKEWYHILRDPRTLLILFGMPVAQVLIFGYAISMEFKDASVGVLDMAQDDQSTEICNRLTASGHFLLTNRFLNYNEIDAAFKRGKIKMAVVFPAGFSGDIHNGSGSQIQLVADGSEPNSSETLINYASVIIQTYFQDKSTIPLQKNIIPKVRMVYNPQLLSVYMFVPGVLAFILMLVSAMLTSLTIAREKEQGTMELLLASPLHPATIITGKVLPYVLLSIINGILIIAVGVWVFEVPIRGSLLLLFALSSLYILTALTIGIFISTKTASQQAAMVASLLILMMPSILLSGFIFPIENMPALLQWIATLIPAKYYIIILKQIMLKGTGFFFVMTPTIILLCMALFFLLLSLKNFKTRLS